MSETKVPPKTRKHLPASSARAARRVVVDFPEQLYRQTEQSAAELDTNRSKFIRLAVKTFIADMRRKRLEHEMAEGYLSMATLSRKTAGEFRHVDSEWP